MKNYRPYRIEPKWQKRWEAANLYRAVDFDKRPKKYVLVEFPYPSGDRLHVGHGRTYCALDVVARKNRMMGCNVLFPFGWDAFGLPAENYAIKIGVNPRETTAQNIANAREQTRSWGLSIDWEREIATTDPSYYRWTQWIFLKLFEKGLAYQAEVPVNWCPKCKTNLANEEVLADGTHERCGCPTERRMQKQWILKITAYADRLLEDLDLVDYLPRIKAQQVNWIGRNDGAEIKFPVVGSDFQISVFTTRPDTIFGVTFLALAPEHPLLEKLIVSDCEAKVGVYVEAVKSKSELERISEIGEKAGVFTGSYVSNPLSKERTPVYVADFVLGSYGTGAVMGVPAHDRRDWDFAERHNLSIKSVIDPDLYDSNFASIAPDVEMGRKSGGVIEVRRKLVKEGKVCYEGKGTAINSGVYTGLESGECKERIIEDLGQRGLGKKAVSYHLRDWVFSRQHYWGEPIPIIHCKKCGVVPVPEKDLPIELPYVENYQPSGTGESPLAAIEDWVNVKCSRCGGSARRETDTMPNWAGSNWYFVRYCDPQNGEEFANFKKLEYWMPVDLYNGGMEHTTLHLLYSRFIYKFLYDCGYVPASEPYARRTSHGVVLGSDGRKMSKSYGNVVNPDNVVAAFGADTFRIYECFMGPFGQMIAWDPKGVEGCSRFLNRVWRLVGEAVGQLGSEAVGPAQSASRIVAGRQSDLELRRELHRLIKKVGEDIEAMKFNTAIAAMMGFLNEVQAQIQTDKTLPSAKNTDLNRSTGGLSKDDWGVFLRLLAPFAPHITEELWQRLNGNVVAHFSARFSIHSQPWPEYDPGLIEEEQVTVVVQVGGKVRGSFEAEKGLSEEEAREVAKALPKVRKHLAGKEVVKVIWVQDRLVNLVTKEK